MTESQSGLDMSNYNNVLAVANLQAFHQTYDFFTSDMGKRWIDPDIAKKFGEHLKFDKISVVATDNITENTAQVITIDGLDARVAIFLNGNYAMRFVQRRSLDLITSILDTATVIKMAVEEVDGLMDKGANFMSNQEFLNRLGQSSL